MVMQQSDLNLNSLNNLCALELNVGSWWPEVTLSSKSHPEEAQQPQTITLPTTMFYCIMFQYGDVHTADECDPNSSFLPICNNPIYPPLNKICPAVWTQPWIQQEPQFPKIFSSHRSTRCCFLPQKSLAYCCWGFLLYLYPFWWVMLFLLELSHWCFHIFLQSSLSSTFFFFYFFITVESWALMTPQVRPAVLYIFYDLLVHSWIF